MKKIVVVDNYDSFTYNLVHALEELCGHPVAVRRNDQLDWQELEDAEYIILSPGPGLPDEAGDLKACIKKYASSKKMLGVCLGHQAIGEVFGGHLQNLAEVFHGVQTPIYSTDIKCPLFDGLHKQFEGGRYHSWVIEKNSLPAEFQVTCFDEAGEIMGFQHLDYALYGVQFHPESILTPDGITILKNFLNLNAHETNT